MQQTNSATSVAQRYESAIWIVPIAMHIIPTVRKDIFNFTAHPSHEIQLMRVYLHQGAT
jgi:hypothetical protein